MIESTPKFLQGFYAYTGEGYEVTAPLIAYTVASDRRAQPVYLRAGNSGDALVVITLTRDGEVMRLFPIGAKSGLHVPLAVVEDISPDSALVLSVSAPAGISGTVVLDFGLVEI